MNKDTPARKAMKFYFERDQEKKFKGRKHRTIVTTLNIYTEYEEEVSQI